MSNSFQNKKPFAKIKFLALLGSLYILTFLLVFIFTLNTYPRFGETAETVLYSNIYLVVVPSLLSIALTYLIIVLLFYSTNHYINKKFIEKFKDALAHISVFCVVLVNGINLFNGEFDFDVLSFTFDTEDQLVAILSEFLVTLFQPVNITYGIPILFSIPTIVLLALEHTPIITKKRKRIKNTPEKTTTSKSDVFNRSEKIIFETQLNIVRAKKLLNK